MRKTIKTLSQCPTNSQCPTLRVNNSKTTDANDRRYNAKCTPGSHESAGFEILQIAPVVPESSAHK